MAKLTRAAAFADDEIVTALQGFCFQDDAGLVRSVAYGEHRRGNDLAVQRCPHNFNRLGEDPETARTPFD